MPNSPTPLSFVAVGPPRTGTSWLHQVLKGRVNLPRFNKETRFFDERFHLGIDWYRAHYDESSKLPLGEICPTYFYSDEARRRLSSTQRRCRIICTFRDPVTRVFSLYKLKRAYAKVPWSFEDALQHDPELLESSRYAHYLSEWRRTFGAENVLVLFYEDLATNAQGYMDRVADFIGIPRFQLSDGDLQYINSSHNLAIPRLSFLTRFGDGTAEWLKARHWGKFASFLTSSPLRGIFLGGGQPIPRPLPSTLSMLRERFRVEVEDLEKLVDRDLSAWKYREVGASH
jgi:hypothetical protein